MKKAFDYLIVGQGLAGTCFAFTLQYKYNKSVLVVDRDSGKKCSAIAAGTYNPLVPRTFTPAWKAAELIPFLRDFYHSFSEYLNLDLINNRPVYKTLKNEDQRNLWTKKSAELPSSMFMQTEIVEELDQANAKFGFGRVKQSGNINMSVLLSEFRLKLKSKGCLLEEVFDFEELTASAYKEFEFKNIVFCQGHENLKNPFFKDLPFKQTKGEVLIIRSEKWKKKGIVHNSINIVPMGNDLYWVGSTFDWDDLSMNISQVGKDKLINQLRQIMQCEFEVIEQKAGIRPTVIDRRPILGGHSDQKNYYVFNGLGTRGVMIAPYYANELILHIEEGKKLEEEVSISRFIESE